MCRQMHGSSPRVCSWTISWGEIVQQCCRPTPSTPIFPHRLSTPFQSLKIGVGDIGWSESPTSVSRSRGLRFRGCETAPDAAMRYGIDWGHFQ